MDITFLQNCLICLKKGKLVTWNTFFGKHRNTNLPCFNFWKVEKNWTFLAIKNQNACVYLYRLEYWRWRNIYLLTAPSPLLLIAADLSADNLHSLEIYKSFQYLMLLLYLLQTLYYRHRVCKQNFCTFLTQCLVIQFFHTFL